jgi:ATP-dependent helicase/nuclease subunit B
MKTRANRGRVVLASEISGALNFDGVKVMGRADRIDRLADGTLAIVDYNTGAPPSKQQVTAGFALQLGLLGLMARDGTFERDGLVVTGDPARFEYWSLLKNDGEFGDCSEPLKRAPREAGLLPEDFLPHHEDKLRLAISRFIRGRDPFKARENPDYAGYDEYDQLMRLEEWVIRLTEAGDVAEGAA